MKAVRQEGQRLRNGDDDEKTSEFGSRSVKVKKFGAEGEQKRNVRSGSGKRGRSGRGNEGVNWGQIGTSPARQSWGGITGCTEEQRARYGQQSEELQPWHAKVEVLAA